MAHGRMLKKIISKSRKLANLENNANRLIYTWLLSHLDIEGRHEGDPQVIKGFVFPRINSITPNKIRKALIDMQEQKLINIYIVNSDTFIEYVDFKKHQILREDREAKSDIPAKSCGTPAQLQEFSGSTQAQDKLSLNKDKLSKDNKRLLVEDSNEFQLSKLLYDKILVNNPNHKMPNLQEWAKHIDYMIRIDKRRPVDIVAIIQWCQSDSFWWSNILSTLKLRKQFDTLTAKMKEIQPKKSRLEDTGHGQRKYKFDEK